MWEISVEWNHINDCVVIGMIVYWYIEKYGINLLSFFKKIES